VLLCKECLVIEVAVATLDYYDGSFEVYTIEGSRITKVVRSKCRYGSDVEIVTVGSKYCLHMRDNV
jgi:hypothetical protein